MLAKSLKKRENELANAKRQLKILSQGIFENGKVTLQKGDWNKEFADQLVNFPNAQMHDDLVDSLAYIQQIAQTEVVFDTEIEEEYQSLDLVSGY